MYTASSERYDTMVYNRCGKSGLLLPAVSLGLWHNFGTNADPENMKAMLRTAFDLGITHFDLANNYGPEYGSAETNFGKILKEDFAPYRDEMYAVGLGEKIESMAKELFAGPGAVRATLHKYTLAR